MPESQRIAAAGLFGAAPNEADAPSKFYVTPPDAALPVAEQDQWLASYFNRATLPVIAVHEVAPGHFAHSRAWRRAAGTCASGAEQLGEAASRSPASIARCSTSARRPSACSTPRSSGADDA